MNATKDSKYLVPKYYNVLYRIMRTCALSDRETVAVVGYMMRVERTRGIKSLIDLFGARLIALLGGSTSFRHHMDGTWYGPLRPLSRLALRGRRGLRRALRILKVVGLFVHPHPLKSDYKKVAKDLRQNVEKDSIKYPFEGMKSMLSLGDYPKPVVVEREQYYPQSTTSVPLGPNESLPEAEVSPFEHIETMRHFPRIVIRHYDYFQRLLGKSMPTLDQLLRAEKRTSSDVAGSMSLLTKDRKYKLRPVANTNRILQLACSRLSDTLFEYLRVLPGCYVFNQESGASWVSDRLKEGWELSSVDLKSASDNIPMLPQVALGKVLFPALTEDLDVFSAICRMEWWTPHEDVSVSWKCGTPMGVKGSFPLFTLWLSFIFLLLKGRSRFAIVGDDLVFDSELLEPYLEVLGTFGVPISEHKSLFNNPQYAEFVGQILDKRGSLEVYKAAERNVIDDPLGLLRQYGARSFRFLTPRRSKETTKRALELVHSFRAVGAVESLEFYLTPKEKSFFRQSLPRASARTVTSAILLKMMGESYVDSSGREHPEASRAYDWLHRAPGRALDLILRFDEPALVQAWKFAEFDPLLSLIVNQLAEIVEAEDLEEDHILYEHWSKKIPPIGNLDTVEMEVRTGRRHAKERPFYENLRGTPLSTVYREARIYERALARALAFASILWTFSHR